MPYKKQGINKPIKITSLLRAGELANLLTIYCEAGDSRPAAAEKAAGAGGFA